MSERPVTDAERPTGELIDETLALDGKATEEQWRADGWKVTIYDGWNRHALATFDADIAYAADVTLSVRYRTLAPEIARRLRDADKDLREVRAALEVGPGVALDGELADAIEGLQQQAAKVAGLERRVAELLAERDQLRCDLRRGQAS